MRKAVLLRRDYERGHRCLHHVGAATLVQASTAARRIWRLHPPIGVRVRPMQRIDQIACNGFLGLPIGCIIKIISKRLIGNDRAAGQNLSELGLPVSYLARLGRSDSATRPAVSSFRATA